MYQTNPVVDEKGEKQKEPQIKDSDDIQQKEACRR